MRTRTSIATTPVTRKERVAAAAQHGPYPTPLAKIPRVDETECVGCNLCALACPENLIVVTSERSEVTKRKELITFTYDTSRCMFCGLCEDACPVDALELTQDFEMATYTGEGQIWDRQTLEEGPKPTQYKC